MEITYLTLMLTDACNLSCPMCGQNAYRNKERRRDLSFEKIIETINQLPDLKTIYLFGGEPTIYKDFAKLLHFLKDKGIKILITTNGILNEEIIQSIVECGVDNVTFSIDSIDSTKYGLVRSKNELNRVLNSLDRLVSLRNERKLVYPRIGINSVILPELSNDMIKLVDYFQNNYLNEIDRINFEAPIQTNLKLGKEYEELLIKKFDVLPMSWKWFYGRVGSFSKIQLDTINKSIEQLKENSIISFLAPTDHVTLLDVLNNNYILEGWGGCSFILDSVTILPNGDVTYCTDFPDLKFGNIFEQPINKIFNNCMSNKFRELIKENNLSICSRCPRIYQNDEFIMDGEKNV